MNLQRVGEYARRQRDLWNEVDVGVTRLQDSLNKAQIEAEFFRQSYLSRMTPSRLNANIDSDENDRSDRAASSQQHRPIRLVLTPSSSEESSTQAYEDLPAGSPMASCRPGRLPPPDTMSLSLQRTITPPADARLQGCAFMTSTLTPPRSNCEHSPTQHFPPAHAGGKKRPRDAPIPGEESSIKRAVCSSKRRPQDAEGYW